MQPLDKFEADPDLALLEQTLERFDAFAFLGMSRSEEVHSNVLAWLLNPSGNHGAGDFFLTSFLLETKAASDEEIRDIDWSDTTVQREWHNTVNGVTGYLDILIVNVEARFVCAIENKVFSGEHSEQLTRYRKAIERQYRGFSKSYLFVSRHGGPAQQPKERECWTPVGYGTIQEQVEQTIARGLDPVNEDVEAFLRQYATTLRRRIVPGTELHRLAARIYLRHSEAIELIYGQKYGYVDDLVEICKCSIAEQKSWEIVNPDNGKDSLGFIDSSWKELGGFDTGTGWQPYSDGLLILAFDFRKVGEVTLILTMVPGTCEGLRKRLFDMTQGEYPDIFDPRGSPLGGYRDKWVRLYKSEPILSKSDLIDGDAASWRSKVTTWVSDFAKGEFPEMDKIILRSFRNIEAEQANR